MRLYYRSTDVMFMRDNSAAVTAFLIRDARHLKHNFCKSLVN